MEKVNEKIEKLKVEKLASPLHGRDLPNLSFGSISLSSSIRSKNPHVHAETTKNESKLKIEFNTIQNPMSPVASKTNDSALNFYACPPDEESGSIDRTVTEMHDNLQKV